MCPKHKDHYTYVWVPWRYILGGEGGGGPGLSCVNTTCPVRAAMLPILPSVPLAHALPLFRDDKTQSLKRKRVERLDTVKSRKPQLPVRKKGKGGGEEPCSVPIFLVLHTIPCQIKSSVIITTTRINKYPHNLRTLLAYGVAAL